MNLTAKQKLERAYSTVVRTKELMPFSPFLMLGDAVIDNSDTAYTDGRNIHYGEAFISELTDEELVFVCLHESLHIGYRHLTTWDKLYKEDALLANSACDYVINLILHDLTKVTNKIRFPMRDGKPLGLLEEKYRGMDTMQIYRALQAEDKQQQQQQQQPQQQQPQQQQPQQQQPQQQQPQQQQSQQGQGSKTPLRQKLEQQQFDDHDFDAAAEMSEDEREEMTDNIDRSVRQMEIAAGKLGVDLPRELKELLRVEIDWKDVLLQFVQSSIKKGRDKTTFRRYNRRTIGLSAHDVYLPSRYSERLSKVVFAIDTSGSVFQITEKFIAHVMEVSRVVNPSEVHLIYWDSKVKKHETYSPGAFDSIGTETKPSGGGGTDVRCVPEYMRANGLDDADCVVVLTDGEFFYGQGDWNDTPVLWAVVAPYDVRFTPVTGCKVTIK